MVFLRSQKVIIMGKNTKSSWLGFFGLMLLVIGVIGVIGALWLGVANILLGWFFNIFRISLSTIAMWVGGTGIVLSILGGWLFIKNETKTTKALMGVIGLVFVISAIVAAILVPLTSGTSVVAFFMLLGIGLAFLQRGFKIDAPGQIKRLKAI